MNRKLENTQTGTFCLNSRHLDYYARMDYFMSTIDTFQYFQLASYAFTTVSIALTCWLLIRRLEWTFLLKRFDESKRSIWKGIIKFTNIDQPTLLVFSSLCVALQIQLVGVEALSPLRTVQALTGPSVLRKFISCLTVIIVMQTSQELHNYRYDFSSKKLVLLKELD